MDTSGPPDQTVAYVSGQGKHQATRTQTDPKYVAVAAYTPIEQGTTSELLLEWSTVAPINTLNQYASRKQAE
ncbi:MAG: hypothetical protein NT005_02915 [Spirochaetes bacterium]|nr:hypothetical protein [Spirochaetota bacterium]MCX7038074.1 hypothetical protein [Spirochaetota bacterium]